jgi:hypothetical protein
MRHAPTPTRPAGGGSRRAGWLAWSRVGTSAPEARAPRCYPAERRSELGCDTPPPPPAPLGAGVAAQDGLRGRELGQACRRRVLPGVTPLNAGASWGKGASAPEARAPRQ